ncbi:HalOD1 output domain-containing protein [Halovivax cerinus]|uniref:HalOD1 output domain-containing protein n=1 Tax=Halovivax cerinus TaxID=1487865 RepID=A0ABD5NQL0_9EURY|nr:HalOD1 output domain-containing protein [Halovivax cerinus]
MNTNTPSTITTDEQPSLRVVKAVAEADGTDPATLDPPLHAAVDPSALDRVFADTPSGSRRGAIRFSYRDHDVTVDADGRVELE